MKRPFPVQITIPEPCSQPWDEMRPNQNGRHCTHCQQTVVDFTWMTDVALLEYVQRNGLGCGRLNNDQLNRIIASPKEPKQNWLLRMVLSIGLLLGIQKEGYAQNTNRLRTEYSRDMHSLRVQDQPLMDAEKDTSAKFSGNIYDESGNPIINAVVTLSEFGKIICSAMADFDGHYKISISSKEIQGHNLLLKVSYLNSTDSLQFNAFTQGFIHDFSIKRVMFSENVVGMIDYRRPNLLKRAQYRIKRFFHSK
jgi:hypothetical protein